MRVEGYLPLQGLYRSRIVLASLRAIYSTSFDSFTECAKAHSSLALRNASGRLSPLTGAVQVSYRARFAPRDILDLLRFLHGVCEGTLLTRIKKCEWKAISPYRGCTGLVSCSLRSARYTRPPSIPSRSVRRHTPHSH